MSWRTGLKDSPKCQSIAVCSKKCIQRWLNASSSPVLTDQVLPSLTRDLQAQLLLLQGSCDAEDIGATAVAADSKVRSRGRAPRGQAKEKPMC